MENRGSRSLSLLLLKFTQLAEGRDLIQTQFHQNSHAQTIDQQGQDVSGKALQILLHLISHFLRVGLGFSFLQIPQNTKVIW